MSFLRTDAEGSGAHPHAPESTPELASDFALPAPARYRSLLLLGHGGMGSVEAAAEDLEDGTTRVVALKRILRAAMARRADAPRVQMFLREARLTTLLRHPNVIRSFAYGEALGEVFLAMEYVAGEPLSRILAAANARGDRLPPSVVAHILSEACQGLHAAHELTGVDGTPLGVVHRDISPHNVMVGYDGSVKLLDFGVAKIDLLDSESRTKTGEVKGKTAYMSPEQAMGDPIDRRSDLYSLGAVLFECLAGRRMWGTGTDLDVLRKLALEEPPALAEATRDVPAALAALYGRLIARDRANRPDTAEEVARELSTFAASDGTNGGPVDASHVRAMMARLFEGERERREAAIEVALRGGLDGREPGAAAARTALSAGESGPVFVTHRGGSAPGRAAKRTWWLAPSVALLCASGAFAFALTRARGGPSPRVDAKAAPATVSRGSTDDLGPSVNGSAAVEPEPRRVAPTVSVVLSASAQAVHARPPLHLNPSAGSSSSASVPAGEGTTPRRLVLATPHPAVGSPLSPAAPAPLARTGTAGASASSTAPAAVRPTEPPDVDPTPF